jgi:superfamily II DNA/RNA helicase
MNRNRSHDLILSMLKSVDPSKNVPQVICICKSKEQVKELNELINLFKSKIGVEITLTTNSTLQRIEKPIVIGTPGIIHDLRTSKKKYLTTDQVKLVIIDEVNEIKDSPKQICFKIQKLIPNARYLLFCSQNPNDFSTEFQGRFTLTKFPEKFSNDFETISKDVQK